VSVQISLNTCYILDRF